MTWRPRGGQELSRCPSERSPTWASSRTAVRSFSGLTRIVIIASLPGEPPRAVVHVPSACQRESQRGCASRVSPCAPRANRPSSDFVTPPTADERIAWPGAEAPSRRHGYRRSQPGDSRRGRLHWRAGSWLASAWLMSKAGRRTSERLGLADVSATSFRPRTLMLAGDGSATPCANAPPEMVLPMSFSVGFGNADRNAFRADDRLLIPHPDRVNQKVHREFALAHL